MARKPRNLSPEEEVLWSSVAKTTAPLRKERPTLLEPAKPTAKKRAPARFVPPTFEIGQGVGAVAQTRVDLAPDVAHRVASASLSMDKKTFKKLSRGRMAPEARIDLHGLVMADAQPALIGFIMSSHASGLRLVLVITGKGRSGKDGGGPVPERRGILRDQVPQWLSMAPCRSVVLQVAQAHASHGGGGAYYVYLRRTRK